MMHRAVVPACGTAGLRLLTQMLDISLLVFCELTTCFLSSNRVLCCWKPFNDLGCSWDNSLQPILKRCHALSASEQMQVHDGHGEAWLGLAGFSADMAVNPRGAGWGVPSKFEGPRRELFKIKCGILHHPCSHFISLQVLVKVCTHPVSVLMASSERRITFISHQILHYSTSWK